MSDFSVKAWADKLEPYNTPILNYIQKFNIALPNHSAAITGYTAPAHPHLARLLIRPVRLLRRLSDTLVAAAGYQEDDDPYADGSGGLVPSGRGVLGLFDRLATTRAEWVKTEPIYDQEKVAQIDRKFREDHPGYGRMEWGVGKR